MTSEAHRGQTSAEFFAELDRREHEPLLYATSGTLRFDLVDGGRVDRWFVTVERGAVSVSHKRAKADCVVRASRELFDRILSGRANAMTAMLRGEIDLEGDPQLMLLFQRLFPGPPNTTTKERSS